MADREGWVNAEVTLVIPLDTVRPSDSSWAKQEALAEAIERVTNALPPDLAECCGFGRWEDVEAEATPPAREAEKPCDICEGFGGIDAGGEPTTAHSSAPCPSCGGSGRTGGQR